MFLHVIKRDHPLNAFSVYTHCDEVTENINNNKKNKHTDDYMRHSDWG